MINPKEYGVIGNRVADDTVALQNAINAASEAHDVVNLQGLKCKITSPLILTTNTGIVGDMYSFNSCIVPVDCPAIVINGDNVAGFAFNVRLENILINNILCTTPQPYSVLIKNAYRCDVTRIRTANTIVNTDTGFNAVVKLEGILNHNFLEKLMIVGKGNTGSGSLIHVENSEGVVNLQGCDVENAFRGIYCAQNSNADIDHIYAERCGTAVRFMCAFLPSQTPQINVTGGIIKLASATSVGFGFNGSYTNNELYNINSVRFQSDDHATKRKAFAASGFTKGNSKINLQNIDRSWIDIPAALEA